MNLDPWPRGTGKNFGLIAPDSPPPQVSKCKAHGHQTDSFVLTTEEGSFEHYTCNLCRLVWRESLRAD